MVKWQTKSTVNREVSVVQIAFSERPPRIQDLGGPVTIRHYDISVRSDTHVTGREKKRGEEKVSGPFFT